MRHKVFSRLNGALTRLRVTLDAGPGATSGEPLSVAGHRVFAPTTASQAGRVENK